jgi:hypothetical protein
MPRKNRATLLLLASSLAVSMMAGCGSGPKTTGPVAGGFTNASLNGTYAFALSGTNAGGFFAVAGSFQANGNGAITGGTEDFNSPGTPLLLTAVPITGTYAVRSDGRTAATITTTSTSPAFTIDLDFVLLNTSTGLAVRFQQTATASGSIDLQNSSAFNLASLTPASYAFSLAGVDSAGHPEASAALLNLDASGDIIGGSVLDDNDNGAITTNASIAATGLAVSSPVGGSGRGTLTFPSPVSGTPTLHFAYYVVDANHLKIVEIDPGVTSPALAGDAFRQTSTTISGSFAFTLAGTSSASGVFAAGGILDTDGGNPTGNILNTSVEDADNGVNVTPSGGAGISGPYSVSGGRGTMTLNGGLQTLNLVFYPSTGGLLMLDIDTNLVASGTALPQSGTPFSNTSINGAYGLNLTGVNVNEVDAIAQFNSSGNGSLSGVMDFNNSGSLSNSLTLNGNYSVSANGRGTARLNTSLESINIIFYMASNSRVLFIESDPNQISVGAFALQQ